MIKNCPTFILLTTVLFTLISHNVGAASIADNPYDDTMNHGYRCIFGVQGSAVIAEMLQLEHPLMLHLRIF